MWFHRKPRNRRHGRQFVLDVKLRSSQVRATRMRMAATALAVVFTTVLGVCLAVRGGQWALERLIWENEAFGIQVIEVQTDGVLSVDEMRRWTGVRVGSNLLALDLARVKRDLEMVSLIESVSVERVLPRTLRIRVVEREPMAQIHVPRPKPGGGVELKVLHLDAQGWVMAPADPLIHERAAGLATESLPTIGLTSSEVQVGRRIASPSVQAALKFLVAFGESSLQGVVDVKRVDASAADVLTVTTGQRSEIVIGLTDFERQLRRWQVVQEAAQRSGKGIATLDLAVSNNIPARWLEASALPPAPPKVIKPQRPRKKHV